MAKTIVVTRQYQVVEAENETYEIDMETLGRFILETNKSVEDSEELFDWLRDKGELIPSYENWGSREETLKPNVYTSEVWEN